MAGVRAYAHELIHDPAARAGVKVFGALGEARQRRGVDANGEHVEQCQRAGDQHRCRRSQSGADGYRPVDTNVGALDLNAFALQLQYDTAHAVRPVSAGSFG